MNDEVKELLITEEDEGIFAMSLVENPAIEVDFVYFSKEQREEVQLKTINREQRIVAGPALIPNLKIPREEGQIVMSKKSVKLAAHKFMKEKLGDQVTVEHNGEKVGGVNLIESWIIEDPKRDKAFSLGYNLPKGTWMAMYKVTDDVLWEKVKTGEVKGFSIEGYFMQKEKKSKTTNMSKEDQNAKDAMTFFAKLGKLFLAEDKEKVEKAEDKEEEKMKEEEKVENAEEKKEEKLEEISFPLGTIDIPEELEDEAFEVEANSKQYIVHVYVKTEEVDQPSESGEPVEDPNGEVAEELSQVKAELSKLKAFMNEAAQEVNLSKTQAGTITRINTEKTDVTSTVLSMLKNKNKKSK